MSRHFIYIDCNIASFTLIMISGRTKTNKWSITNHHYLPTGSSAKRNKKKEHGCTNLLYDKQKGEQGGVSPLFQHLIFINT